MIGNTTEENGIPKNIDRGPAEEMRMTKEELLGVAKNIADAKHSIGEVATIKALMNEMKILRAMVDDVCEQNNKLVALYQTIRGEHKKFEQQWNIERHSWLANGGSTTPEDS